MTWAVTALHCAICNHTWAEVHPVTVPAGSECSNCGYEVTE